MSTIQNDSFEGFYNMHTDFFRNIHRIIGEAHRMNVVEEQDSSAGDISRRGFVKGVAASAALMSVPRVALASGKPVPKIAIVGGGLAGLNTAYQLKKVGIAATVYEASSRIGGRVLTVRSALAEGLVTEMGAELVNSDHADIHALAKDFGIGMFLRKAEHQGKIPAVSYYLDGKTWSEKELTQAMRPLVKVIAEDAAKVEADETYAVHIDSLSVADYLGRHAGSARHRAVRQLLEDSIRVEYGVEPEESSALQLIYNLPAVKDDKFDILSESDEAYAVEGGTDRITQGLATALDGQIKTRMKLVHVSQGRKGGYVLRFANGKKIQADFVVLAIPFSILRDVRIDVELPKGLQDFIKEGKLGRNEKVIAGFRERVWQSAQGFLSEAWVDRNFLEVWDSSARQPDIRAGSLTFFLGGKSAVEAAGKTVAQSGKEAVHTLAPFIDGLAQADVGVYMRTSWGSSAYLKGSYSNYAPGQLTRFAPYFWIESENVSEAQEVRVENLIFAGEHLSDSSYGFMNGAAETGRLAAVSLVKGLVSSTIEGKK